MPSFDDDYWIYLLIEEITKCNVVFLDTCGGGATDHCLLVNDVYHHIPLDRLRHNPSRETVTRWFNSLKVAS